MLGFYLIMPIHATLKWIFFILLSVSLCSCSPSHTIIKNSRLTTQTRMSKSIFLDPNDSDNAKVYLQIKNSSGTALPDIENKLVDCLQLQDLEVTKDIYEAKYLIQANILQLGRNKPQFAQKSLKTGYGSAIEGAWIGESIVKSSKDKQSMAGVIGASIATTANALIEDIMYTAIVDIQISEKLDEPAKESIRSSLPQGSGTRRNITLNRNSEWMRYQTRIVSSVNKVNLSENKALTVLESQLINSISGIIL